MLSYSHISWKYHTLAAAACRAVCRAASLAASRRYSTVLYMPHARARRTRRFSRPRAGPGADARAVYKKGRGLVASRGVQLTADSSQRTESMRAERVAREERARADEQALERSLISRSVRYTVYVYCTQGTFEVKVLYRTVLLGIQGTTCKPGRAHCAEAQKGKRRRGSARVLRRRGRVSIGRANGTGGCFAWTSLEGDSRAKGRQQYVTQGYSIFCISVYSKLYIKIHQSYQSYAATLAR